MLIEVSESLESPHSTQLPQWLTPSSSSAAEHNNAECSPPNEMTVTFLPAIDVTGLILSGTLE
jgi:hypothetical protein